METIRIENASFNAVMKNNGAFEWAVLKQKGLKEGYDAELQTIVKGNYVGWKRLTKIVRLNMKYNHYDRQMKRFWKTFKEVYASLFFFVNLTHGIMNQLYLRRKLKCWNLSLKFLLLVWVQDATILLIRSLRWRWKKEKNAKKLRRN